MNKDLTFNDLPEAVTMLINEVSELRKLLLEKQEQQLQAPSEKLLSIKEAADFLNLTVPTIYSKVSRNELPYMKQGKRLYFSSTDLMNYIKEGKHKSNAEIEAEAEAYMSKSEKGVRYDK